MTNDPAFGRFGEPTLLTKTTQSSAVPNIPVRQIPKQNWCVYFGPGSAIKTQMSFETFFDKDHTIAGWFMPQYARGGHGPLFASNGTQRYFVGQGDYHSGDALVSSFDLAPGVDTKEGSGVLTIFIGSQKRIYLAPAWKAGVWQHVAAIRKSDVVSLYLNGAKLQPVSVNVNKNASDQIVSKTVTTTSDLQVPLSVDGASLGHLILGRSKHPTLTAYAQAYGLLDDIAVFDHALTAAEVSALFDKKRVTGYESGLIAGWGFDTPAGDDLLPSKLSGTVVESDISGNLTISADRNSGVDRLLLDFPPVFAKSTPAVAFPFPKGQEWKVVQGYCDPTYSHNGDDAAFCYDLALASGSSAHTPVYAFDAGYVYLYLRNGEVKEREPNRVVLYNDVAGFCMSYLHFEGNSLTEAVVDGDPPVADADAVVTVWPQTKRMVSKGAKIGLVGPKAEHVHLGAKEVVFEPPFPIAVKLSKNQIPVAFKGIEVKSSGDADFHGILGIYIPKKGDVIRAV
jgi:hypothetical protein